MKKNVKINPAKGIADLIKRSNLVIFITIIVCILIFAIINLSNLLTPTSTVPQPTSSTAASNASSFDQATIESLNKLSPADSNNPVVPSGRIDPFSE